jgi:hypothetical protein
MASRKTILPQAETLGVEMRGMLPDRWSHASGGSPGKLGEGECWLPLRDSNPNMLIQSQLSYH